MSANGNIEYKQFFVLFGSTPLSLIFRKWKCPIFYCSIMFMLWYVIMKRLGNINLYHLRCNILKKCWIANEWCKFWLFSDGIHKLYNYLYHYVKARTIIQGNDENYTLSPALLRFWLFCREIRVHTKYLANCFDTLFNSQYPGSPGSAIQSLNLSLGYFLDVDLQ